MALQVFNEALEYFGGLQQQGEIEAFEPVSLERHGGDLYGFFLLRGDPERLSFVALLPVAIRVAGHYSVTIS